MERNFKFPKVFATALSILLVVALLFSVVGTVLGDEGGELTSRGEFVQHIRLEVRMDQSVGVRDTAFGALDVFIQSVDGPYYDELSDEWKAQLKVLESYDSYNNLFFNTATTGGYAEVDTNDDGNLDYFNPWAIREIRYATNWLIEREHIVEDIYDGYGIGKYSAIGQRNPVWNEYFQPLIDARNITYEGDFETAYNMIQDAMTDAMNHRDLEGELRPPTHSPSEFWQYRPPGGEWKDVETEGLIRIEDKRLQIGRLFSDQLEKCGIRVDRFESDKQFPNLWLWTDAADMEWGFYTGGWVASTALAYQHAVLAQMYTHHYPFMPGDAYYMYIGGDAGTRYAYNRDNPAAQEIYDLATPLMTGHLTDEDAYWEMSQALLDSGIHESVRVFISAPMDVIPLNKNSVVEVIKDEQIGWSQIFSPRTIRTTTGELTAAQFSATGTLYMDNWNDIGGFADHYSTMQSRISRDFATAMDPARGVPMGMRADWMEVRRDYEYDEDGNLTKSIPIPDNVVNYDVFTEEWTEGYGWKYADDEGTIQTEDYAATAVTYKWHFGTWHSGHEFTMQDLVASFAFSKQLCWETDAGSYYHASAMVSSRPYYNNILGIVFNEAEDTVTIYGDYTFPTDPQIGGYYMWMPEVPWQQYEAASQLIGLTDLAPSDPLNGQAYNWASRPGTNHIHWLSSAQGNDFTRTLQNMAEAQFVPPYLQAGRNSPMPLTPGDDGDDIQAMRAFYDEYGHFWITQGPFKLVTHDRENLVIEYERWTQADGYPFPDDHWRDKLTFARLTLGTIRAPRNIIPGDPLSLSVRARVVEEYPNRVIRSLKETDDYSVTGTLFKGNETVFETTDLELVDSELRLTIPGNNTQDLEPGIYDARIRVHFQDMPYPAEAKTNITVLDIYEEPLPEPMPVPEGIENITLDVVPKSGDEPLTVTIEVGATNLGNESAELDIYVNGIQEYTLNIPANDTAKEEWTRSLEIAGEYLIQVGELYEVVEVTEEEVPPPPPENDTPGFAFLSLTIGITLSFLAYGAKKVKIGR